MKNGEENEGESDSDSWRECFLYKIYVYANEDDGVIVDVMASETTEKECLKRIAKEYFIRKEPSVEIDINDLHATLLSRKQIIQNSNEVKVCEKCRQIESRIDDAIAKLEEYNHQETDEGCMLRPTRSYSVESVVSLLKQIRDTSSLKVVPRKKLQTVSKYKLMTFNEAAKALGWKWYRDLNEIHVCCDCGGEITYTGLGYSNVDVVECQQCKKTMADILAPHQDLCPIVDAIEEDGVITPDRFEAESGKDGLRCWIASDANGGILYRTNKTEDER